MSTQNILVYDRGLTFFEAKNILKLPVLCTKYIVYEDTTRSYKKH